VYLLSHCLLYLLVLLLLIPYPRCLLQKLLFILLEFIIKANTSLVKLSDLHPEAFYLSLLLFDGGPGDLDELPYVKLAIADLADVMPNGCGSTG
jgi:hypothetical protein